MRARLLGAVLVSCALAGCGLPTPDGVQSAGEISSEQQQADALSVRPPNPLPGATPEQVVRGFLAAQSSPDDGYGVARSFLAPGTDWDPAVGVRVVSALPALGAAPVPADQAEVSLQVERDVLGRIDADGWSERLDLPDQPFPYALARVNGEWRLTSVPEGLTLTEDERARSMAVVQVMFLSPAPGRAHLVHDLVRVPNDGQLARRLVEQVVDGPSQGLAGSARSAVPLGTRVLSVTQGTTGEVTVDLSAPVAALAESDRADLSAQLLWTLRLGLDRDLSAMRLLVEGQPLEVDGDDGPQPRDRWDALDPTGGPGPLDALAVAAGGRVVSIDPEGLLRTAVEPRVGRAVEAVQDASGERVAVLTGPADGELRSLAVGTAPDGLVVVRRDQQLVSPTWGDGAYGVWSLRLGPSPAVVVDQPGVSSREVEVVGEVALSRTSVLRVSRDGARVALIDDSRTLRVGRIERVGTLLRVVDLVQVSADGSRVRDVAWVDGTTLLALDAEPDPDIPRPLLQVDVDGVARSSTSLNTPADANTRTLTAFGEQVLVGADSGERSPTDNGLSVVRGVGGLFADRVPGVVRPRLPD